MSTPPNKQIRAAANPQPMPAAGQPAAAAPGGSPFSNFLNKQGSNRNLFILLGIAGAVLFFCMTFSLIWFLVGGGSSKTANPGGSMFPDDGKGSSTAGLKLPPNPGVVAQKPRDAINGLLRDLRDDRVEDAYNRTSRGFQLGMTPEQFRQMLDMKRAFRYYTSFEIKPLSPESGSEVHYAGKVTGGPYGTVEFNAEVVKEDRGWVIRVFVPD